MSTVYHRDSYLSPEDMVHYLRLAWHERVTQDFCITEEEAEDYLQEYPAEILLRGMFLLAKWLRKEKTEYHRAYLEDEIIHYFKAFVKEELNRAVSTTQHIAVSKAHRYATQ